MTAKVERLKRDLAAAQKKSWEAAAKRGALPAGSTRARVTTANAKWSRAAEHRDRIEEELHALTHCKQCGDATASDVLELRGLCADCM